MDFASIIDRVAQNVQAPEFQQQLAYISAIRNGQDPQEAMLNQARLDAANAQGREAARQKEVEAQLPRILQGLKNSSPQEVLDTLAPIIGFEQAYQYAESIAKMNEPKAPNTQGLPEGYMWGDNNQAVPIEGLPPQQKAPKILGKDDRYILNEDGTATPIQGLDALPPEIDVGKEGELRKEVNALNTDFRQVRDAYNKVKVSVDRDSAAGDLALIFNYMKMLDPGSVVREGEFATAQNAAGVPDRIRNTYNNIISGERLNPSQRQDFMKTAKGIYGSQLDTYNQDAARYRDIAKQYGFDPDRIITPISIEDDLQQSSITKSAQDDGLTPAEWDAMTPEERALWQD